MVPTEDDPDVGGMYVDLFWPDEVYAAPSERCRYPDVCPPIYFDSGKADSYFRMAADHPNLRYLIDFHLALAATDAVGHGQLYLLEPTVLDCFLIWHRDIQHFATDLLWALVYETCEMLPQTAAIVGQPDPAAALLAAIRTSTAAGGRIEPDRYRPRSLWPEDYSQPRVELDTLADLLAHVDEVAERLAGMQHAELRGMLATCTTSDFQAVGDGGVLWARSGVRYCVDEFYVRLAEHVLSGT